MHRLKKMLLEQMDYESILLERFEKEMLTYSEGSLSLKNVKGNAYQKTDCWINSYTFSRESAKSRKAFEGYSHKGKKNSLHFLKKIYNKISIYNKSIIREKLVGDFCKSGTNG